jgi:hypothetical protein
LQFANNVGYRNWPSERIVVVMFKFNYFFSWTKVAVRIILACVLKKTATCNFKYTNLKWTYLKPEHAAYGLRNPTR